MTSALPLHPSTINDIYFENQRRIAEWFPYHTSIHNRRFNNSFIEQSFVTSSLLIQEDSMPINQSTHNHSLSAKKKKKKKKKNIIARVSPNLIITEEAQVNNFHRMVDNLRQREGLEQLQFR